MLQRLVNPNNGKFLTNTTTCCPVDLSSSAQSAPAGLYVDFSFSTPNFCGGEAGRASFCPQSTSGSTVAATKEGWGVSLSDIQKMEALFGKTAHI
jgi:hypothetical protein